MARIFSALPKEYIELRAMHNQKISWEKEKTSKNQQRNIGRKTLDDLNMGIRKRAEVIKSNCRQEPNSPKIIVPNFGDYQPFLTSILGNTFVAEITYQHVMDFLDKNALSGILFLEE